MHSITNTELSSPEGTRCQFNGGRCAIKLGIDVHQDFYVVVEQVGGTNPKPPQRFHKEVLLHWAAKLKQSGAEVHAVYEACGVGFSLQRQLAALGIHCHVVCPQKLDEHNKRVKTVRFLRFCGQGFSEIERKQPYAIQQQEVCASL
jgi:transposase